MRRHLRNVFLVLAALLAVGCVTPSILTPVTGPNTAWACRPQEHDCGSPADEAKGLDTCCADTDVCGGGPFNGCPAKSCCYIGSDDEVGAHRPTPMRSKVAR